jgi:quercetin dioxygenase-like cupin family protein
VANYSTTDLDELDGEGPTGGVRKVRRALGGQAFGLNHFTIPAGQEGHEHDESSSGQEEVVFVVKGSGTMRVDGEDVELKPGRFVRIDPQAVRVPVAGPDGLEFVAVGAPVDAKYEPPSWG